MPGFSLNKAPRPFHVVSILQGPGVPRWVGIQAVIQLLAVIKEAAGTPFHKPPSGHSFSFLLCKYLEVRSLSHQADRYSTL